VLAQAAAGRRRKQERLAKGGSSHLILKQHILKAENEEDPLTIDPGKGRRKGRETAGRETRER